MKPFSLFRVFIMTSDIGGSILMGIKNKNVVDFDALFKEYHAYVFKIVINEGGKKLTKQDQEETVSDIFFKLWQNQRKIKDLKKVKSYIGKIAKNTTKNKVRSIKDRYNFDEGMFSSNHSNENSYHINEQLRIIRRELDNMDPLDKELFLLFYYQNKKIKEIALLKNIKSSTIKTRLHRTRKKLKKLLERRGY